MGQSGRRVNAGTRTSFRSSHGRLGPAAQHPLQAQPAAAAGAAQRAQLHEPAPLGSQAGDYRPYRRGARGRWVGHPSSAGRPHAAVALDMLLSLTLSCACFPLSAQSFEAKALEQASNHTAAAYYADQLSGGLSCIDMQISASRPHHATASPPAASVTGAMPLAHTPPSSRYASAPSMPAEPVRSIPSYHHRPAVAPSSNGHHHPQHIQRVPAAPVYAPSSSAPRSNGGNGLPASTNVEILTAVTLPSLQNARCLCINDAATGKVVSCTQCGLVVHAKCHQLTAVRPSSVLSGSFMPLHCP